MADLHTSLLQSDEILDESLSSGDWIGAGIIAVGSLVLAMLLARLTRRLLNRWIGSGFAAIITARLIGYVVFLIGLFYALTGLGVRVGPLLGALGLGGLVLALALQKMVENFVAGLILQTRRPFTVGDTVRLGDHVGVVTDIDSRTTVLRALDGSEVRVPNANVVSDTTVNLTRDATRRSDLEVGVSYDTDLDAAAVALRGAVDLVPRIRSHPAPMVILTRFGASSIDFTVYYWHASDVPSELATRHDLIVAIHRTFTHEAITIAFPQMVLWQADSDGVAPYEGAPSEVRTDQPGHEQTTSPAGRRRPGPWLRSRRDG